MLVLKIFKKFQVSVHQNIFLKFHVFSENDSCSPGLLDFSLKLILFNCTTNCTSLSNAKKNKMHKCTRTNLRYCRYNSRENTWPIISYSISMVTVIAAALIIISTSMWSLQRSKQEDKSLVWNQQNLTLYQNYIYFHAHIYITYSSSPTPG